MYLHERDLLCSSEKEKIEFFLNISIFAVMVKKKQEPKSKENTGDSEGAQEYTAIELQIESLENQLMEAQNKCDEAESMKLRALADLQNFQRRADEERIRWSSISVGNFIKGFLPRFLELQLGVANTDDEDAKKVVSQFFDQLTKEGLVKIEPQAGDDIDTDFHEVLMVAEGESGKIVQTLEAGWKYKDMIISPAKVSAANQ